MKKQSKVIDVRVEKLIVKWKRTLRISHYETYWKSDQRNQDSSGNQKYVIQGQSSDMENRQTKNN